MVRKYIFGAKYFKNFSEILLSNVAKDKKNVEDGISQIMAGLPNFGSAFKIL